MLRASQESAHSLFGRDRAHPLVVAVVIERRRAQSQLCRRTPAMSVLCCSANDLSRRCSIMARRCGDVQTRPCRLMFQAGTRAAIPGRRGLAKLHTGRPEERRLSHRCRSRGEARLAPIRRQPIAKRDTAREEVRGRSAPRVQPADNAIACEYERAPDDDLDLPELKAGLVIDTDIGQVGLFNRERTISCRSNDFSVDPATIGLDDHRPIRHMEKHAGLVTEYAALAECNCVNVLASCAFTTVIRLSDDAHLLALATASIYLS